MARKIMESTFKWIVVLAMSTWVRIPYAHADDTQTTTAAVCKLQFKFLGQVFASCDGVLINSTEVLTAASCLTHFGTQLIKPEINCGGAKQPAKSSRSNPGFINKDTYDMRIARDIEIQANNLAIYQLEQPSKVPPANVDLDNNVSFTHCSVAQFSAHSESPTFDVMTFFGDFGEGNSIIGSIKVIDDDNLGAPLFCRDRNGKLYLKGIAGSGNDTTNFFAKVDRSKGFILESNSARAVAPARND